MFFYDGDTGEFRKLEGITLDKISTGGAFPLRNELQVWGLKRKDDVGPIILHEIFRAVKNVSNPDLFEFHKVDGELLMVFAGNPEDGSVWGINAFHEIFQFDGNAFVRRDDRKQWIDVSVGRDTVWALASP